MSVSAQKLIVQVEKMFSALPSIQLDAELIGELVQVAVVVRVLVPKGFNAIVKDRSSDA
jgi:hypothetical protein